jgi:hypothetical protein
MTKYPRRNNKDTEKLRQILKHRNGEKFCLDCGHQVTLGKFPSNDIVIINSKSFRIICSSCAY